MTPREELSEKLKKISEIYDVDYLLALKTDPVYTAQFTKLDKVPLKIFHTTSDDAELLAEGKEVDSDGILESVWLVNHHLKKVQAQRVLELGAGSNGCALYLAMKYPKIEFYRAVAFVSQFEYEVKKFRGMKNYHSLHADFTKLDGFEDSSIDISFGVETLSMCDEREKALAETFRVLKKGSVFIVVDGYLGMTGEALSREDLITKHLIGRGRSLKEFDTYKGFLQKAGRTGYTIGMEVDVSKQVMNALERYERHSDKFFNMPFPAKVISSITSSDFAYAMISNYLMPTAMKMGMAKYMITVLSK